jgi:gamma-glutamylcysteine synthetase
MTDLRQAAQQALEALKSAAIFVDSFRGQKATQEAITALQAALEQPSQEPVAWAVQGITQMIRGEFV